MAYLRKLTNSPYWVAVFRDNYGKQHFKTTKVPHSPGSARDRTAARRKAMQVAEGYECIARGEVSRASEVREIAMRLATLVGGDAVKVITAQDLLHAFLDRAERERKSPTTLAKYKGTITRFLAFLGERAGMAAELIRPEDVQGFVDELAKSGLASKTINNHLKILRIPFAEAVDLQKLPGNPAARVRGPELVGVEKQPFTVGELKSIMTATRHVEHCQDWQTAILLGYYCGLRLGDATGLTWRSVDLQACVITLVPEKKRRRGKQIALPMHPSLVAHLMTLPTADDPNAPLCPAFSSADRGMRSRLSKRFHTILKLAGVEVLALGEGRRKVTSKSFHSLRHSLTSHLAAASVAPELRMRLTDHDDPKVHAGYTHHEVEGLRAAVSKLEGIK